MTMWLALAGMFYVAWCGMAYVAQDRVVFPGVTRRGDVPPHLPPDGEVWWAERENNTRVEAWFLPGRGRSAATPGPAVIYTHGNGELIDDWPAGLQPYRAAGVSVLLVEYRGYGRSSGTPSQEAIISDLELYHQRLSNRPDVDATRLVYHGRSLGGGFAAALAARKPPAALVLESTFTSVAGLMARVGIPHVLCKHPLLTEDVVAHFDRPLLILHGTRDEVIPVSHGRRLHALANGSQYVEMEAGHNDFPPDHRAYWRTIETFLAEQAIVSEPPAP